MKFDYHLETFTIGKWLKILQGPMHYCQGFLDARKDYAPRLAYRLMRSDGKIGTMTAPLPRMLMPLI